MCDGQDEDKFQNKANIPDSHSSMTAQKRRFISLYETHPEQCYQHLTSMSVNSHADVLNC